MSTNLAHDRHHDDSPKDDILENALKHILLVVHSPRIHFIEDLEPNKRVEHHRQQRHLPALLLLLVSTRRLQIQPVVAAENNQQTNL